MNNQSKVREFMELAGQDTPNQIKELDDKTKVLRVKLILEELLEYAQATGVEICVGYAVDIDDFEFNVVASSDFVEVADALSDIEYVMHGASNAYGINMEPVFEAVHQSNMKKFGPGGFRREDGKWVKPPDWQKPDIKAILEEQGL